MTHLNREIPYNNTDIPYSRSKSNIDEMLKEFGANALRWTETEASMLGTEMPILEFILEIKLNGIFKKIRVKIQPPLLKKTTGRGYNKKHLPNPNASMRMLYWYLKGRLEATIYGLDDIFETFMSRIMTQLPNGEETSIGEIIKNKPQILNILPTFQIIPVNQLEDKSESP